MTVVDNEQSVSLPVPRTARSRVRRSYRSLLCDRVVILLALMFAVAIGALLWHQSNLQRRLIRSGALESANLYTHALTALRTLYSSEVVEVARRQQVEVCPDYDQGDKKGRAIPLPATLTIKLGNEIASQDHGGQTRLYSAYPFPYAGRHGLQDQFAKDAWDALTQTPAEPFFRFEQLEGRPVLRYATADVMRDSCVDCHNNHRDTPRSNWKAGDVRGVLEVALPLDTAAAQSKAGLGQSTF